MQLGTRKTVVVAMLRASNPNLRAVQDELLACCRGKIPRYEPVRKRLA